MIEIEFRKDGDIYKYVAWPFVPGVGDRVRVRNKIFKVVSRKWLACEAPLPLNPIVQIEITLIQDS